MHYWEHADEAGYGVFHTYDALACDGFGPRKVHVLLPHGWRDGGRRYPTLYLNDGNTSFWPGGIASKSWRVQHSLSELTARGDVATPIVVAVHPNERDRDYTAAPWAPQRACCGLRDYAAELAFGLCPFMRSRYPVMTAPRATAIVGSSHGGTAAFFIATRHPSCFGLAGVLSPSLWVGASYNYAPGGLPLRASNLIAEVDATLLDSKRRPRIWLDWGMVHSGGFHNEVIELRGMERGRELAALLRERYGYRDGLDLAVHEDPDGAHDEDSWARRFPDVWRFLASGLTLDGDA